MCQEGGVTLSQEDGVTLSQKRPASLRVNSPDFPKYLRRSENFGTSSNVH